LITTLYLLEQGLSLDEEGVRQSLSGNLCRCTGYQNIVDAVLAVLRSGDSPG
jgi:aerobic-type carbon monoxide dehydrogenase small subunit (CoxS/CutS family)